MLPIFYGLINVYHFIQLFPPQFEHYGSICESILLFSSDQVISILGYCSDYKMVAVFNIRKQSTTFVIVPKSLW